MTSNPKGLLSQQQASSITKLVNPEWLERNFPCMWACPVHTEAGRYVAAVAEERYEEAYRLARAPNPFASICGRICAAPCESACRRGAYDAPIAIRALKRFVCERYGVESMIDLERIREVLGRKIRPKNKWVAIIGAGPAGLSCAHDLALLGYRVTVFEAQPVAGGMLRLGIPEYRLPRELLRLEINAILSLGVELKLGKALGRDFTLDDLHDNGYQAVFLAFGAHKSRSLNIEGVHLDGVLQAVDFLLNINLGYKVELGEKILVIGGGNVAIDVARTAVRQERREEVTATDIVAALDVARSAVRFGAKRVEMACLEAPHEMPAGQEEIDQAMEERIIIHHRKGPKRILSHNGRVSGLETLDVASVFDAQGRFNPTFIPNTEKQIDADTIIIAIGQAADLSFLKPSDGIAITPRGTIKVDPDTLATTAPGIYAGGDLAFGPRIAIAAIADGRRAAHSIDEYLSGSKTPERKLSILVPDTVAYRPAENYDKIPRQIIPILPLDRRVGIAQVELGYDEALAIRESRRCLKCWINTIFEGTEATGSECILCGGCADICPEGCIEIVPTQRLAIANDLRPMVIAECGIGLAGDDAAALNGTLVMIKDETVCIRCGLCARRCPVGCITMEAFHQMSERNGRTEKQKLL